MAPEDGAALDELQDMRHDVDNRLDTMDKRVVKRLDAMDRRMDKLEKRMNRHSKRVQRMNKRNHAIEEMLQDMRQVLPVGRRNAMAQLHNGRVRSAGTGQLQPLLDANANDQPFAGFPADVESLNALTRHQLAALVVAIAHIVIGNSATDAELRAMLWDCIAR